jgi:multiple sugar transport system permease protein
VLAQQQRTGQPALTLPAKKKSQRRQGLTPWLFLLPGIVMLLAVGIYPVIYALWASLHHVDLVDLASGTPFDGVHNYISAFFNSLFTGAVARSLVFLLISLPLELVLGMLIALYLHGTVLPKLRNVVRVVLVIPMAMTPVVVGLIGSLVFNNQFGLVNYMLGGVHIAPVDWLGNSLMAFIATLALQIWQWTPFVTLILVASLSTVPPEIEEALTLETKSWFKRLRYVQLPYLLPGITAALIFQTAYIVKLYDMVITLTGGGPGVSTELVSIYIERNAFRAFDIGTAAAQSVILLVITVVLSQLYIKFFYQEAEA